MHADEIIGDYRRLALYGLDRLIEAKQNDLRHLTGPMTDARIRLREEVAEQIKALKEIKIMGEQYGLELGRRLTMHRKLFSGYTWLTWAAVKRTGWCCHVIG